MRSESCTRWVGKGNQPGRLALTSPCFLCDGWDFSGKATPKLPHEMSLEPCSCSQIPQEWDNEQLITGLNEEMDSAMYKGTCLSSPFCMHQMLSTHFDLCHTEAHCPYIKGGAGQKVAKSLFLWSDKAGFEMGAGRNSTQPLSRSIRPSSMGCRSSMLSKGMVNDRRGSHLSKRKWPQFSPTIILSLSIQGFQTTSHCH